MIRGWRWPLGGRAADAVLVVVVAVFVFGATLLGVQTSGDRSGLNGWDVLFISATCGALYLRRSHPVPVGVFTVVACAVYYVLSSADGPILITYVIALYTVAAQRHLMVAIVLAVAALLFVGYGELSSPVRHIDNLALFLLTGWLIAVIAVGAASYNRRAYLKEAERSKEEAAVQRATQERLRIARELHDVLGHNLSLINVQAGAAVHRKDADQAQAALVAIKESSKDALRELRATLGVLRQVDEQAPVSPAAGLDRIGELVDRASAAGLDVSAEVKGRARPVTAEIDLAAYRIVQEALTNVTRHARASTALVRIRYGDEDVCVQVDDDGVGDGGGDVTGNGILGMGERARALGGELSAGGRPEGGFRVLARLPLGEPA